MRWWSVAAVVLATSSAACLDAKSVVCGDKVCAPLATCDQATATCIPAGCGDGVVNNKEQCDPASTDPPTDCRALGFYDVAAAACTEACEYDLTACTQRCGDHVLNGPEFCDGTPPDGTSCADFGYGTGRLACSSDCAPRFDDCTAIGPAIDKTANATMISIGGRTDPARFAMYAGGFGGVLLASSGTDWAPVDSHTDANIVSIWAAPETDEAFAVVAGGIIDHEVAGVWTPSQPLAPGLTLVSVWGRAADDVYAVGYIPVSPPTSPPTVDGYVVHWDGGAWSAPLEIAPGAAMRGITGDGSGNLVAVGDNHTIVRYSGGTWTAATPISDTEGRDFNAVVAVPSAAGMNGVEYFAVGDRGGSPTAEALAARSTDGNTWTIVSTPVLTQELTGIVGNQLDAIYAVGHAGLLVRFDATRGAFHVVDTGRISTFNGVFARGDDNLRIVTSDGLILGVDGPMWNDAQAIIDPAYSLQGLATATVGTLQITVAVANGGQFAETGDGVNWVGSTAPAAVTLTGVWISPSLIPYISALGPGIYEPNGSVLQRGPGLSGTTNIHAVWGPPAGTPIFAVGNNAHVWKRDASTWTVETVPNIGTTFLEGVWGTSATDVYAVGDSGTIVHYDGAGWTTMTSNTGTDLTAVWGTSSTDIFAVGKGGTIVHYDGATWRLQHRNNQSLQGVFGLSPVDVFAFGTDAIFHYDGVVWSPLAIPVTFQVLAAASRSTATRFDTVFVGTFGDAVTLDRPREATEIHCSDGWDDDGNGLVDCADPACATDTDCAVAGGNCRIAKGLACDGSDINTTFTGIGRVDNITGVDERTLGPEIAYRFDATADEMVTIALDTMQPLDLVVLPTYPGTAACNLGTAPVAVSAAAGASAGAPRTLTFAAVKDTTYTILLDEAAGAAGDFTLSITCM